MTAADFARFLVIIGLGILAFITFLVAGTIIGLMVVDARECNRCLTYPVGVWILGLLGLFFLVSMAREWSEAPPAAKDWFSKNRTNVLIALIIFIVFLYIFTW